MSSLNKGFKDRLKAAAVITLLLVTYHQISQQQTDSLVDNPSNNYVTAKSDILLKNLFAARR